MFEYINSVYPVPNVLSMKNHSHSLTINRKTGYLMVNVWIGCKSYSVELKNNDMEKDGTDIGLMVVDKLKEYSKEYEYQF